MNQKLTLGLLLVIGLGLLAVPFSSAQFSGGDAGNNEEADFEGGDAGNNEEADFGGGDAGNNEDGDFTGGDAGNNEDEEEEQEETEQEDPSEDDSVSRAGNTHVIDMSYTDNFNLELSPQSVAPGQSFTVSGRLAVEENAERDIDVLIDETRETTVTTGQNGDYQTEVEAPSEAGTYTVVVETDNIRQRAELDVGNGNGELTIGSITTSGETRAGQPIQVCAQVSSGTDAEVTLYQNNQQVDTTTGSGEVCFNPTLESGTNTFRVEASSDTETAEAEITRSTLTDPGTTNGTTAPTGGFLGSPTARLAGVGTIIVLIASAIVLFARQNVPEEPIQP